MRATVRDAVSVALGAEIILSEPVSGGDINETYLVELDGGRRVFVKTNANAATGMFQAEAKGLAWLAEPRAVRLPEVLAVNGPDAPPYLVLEYIQPGRPGAGFDEELGRGLAALHRAGAPSFGLDHDNFIGPLPQHNAAAPTWHEFFRDRRLAPQVERAARAGLLSRSMVSRFEALFARLQELVGDDEPPHRLHGDLWGGNLHVAPDGSPCLIDPAAYAGHREIDLAMMRLFGGFGARVFTAYDEAFPLAPGSQDRVSLYQLYPLLVHVNLFGASYLGSLQSALGRYD